MKLSAGRLALATLLGAVATAPAQDAADTTPRGPDAAPWHLAEPARAPDYSNGSSKHSRYVSAKDGVRLAIDYYLPSGLAPGVRLPTLLQQTRYFRSSVFTGDEANSCKAISADIEYFTTRGYAFVMVDVRGTGASFGVHPSEMSDAEIADTTAVADWIVAQPWSSGRIGTTGISYVGMMAEFALLVGHPAIKAAAPLYPGYDLYADLHFPGGLKGRQFIETWGNLTAEMDQAPAGGITRYPSLQGPCPVDGDDGSLLAAARAEHRSNRNLVRGMAAVEFRDDGRGPGDEWPSAYLRRARLDAANVPTLFIAGWLDAAFGDGAINRFLSTQSRKQRLIIGPHSHAGDYFYGPGTEVTTLAAFDQKAELLRFFDANLAQRATAPRREPRLRWFVTGANEWRESDHWPKPKRTLRWCLAPAGTLDARNCDSPLRPMDISPADIASSGSGRWQTSMAKPIVYPDRAAQDAKLPVFQTATLEHDLEIWGSAFLRLTLRTTGSDADLVVYLEEVDAAGRALYVTEGLLRASHARPGKLPYRSLGAQRTDLRADRQEVRGHELKLDVRLLPVAHRFKAGSTVRLVLAGSDKAVFESATQPADRWTTWTGTSGGAALSLPLAR